MKGFTGCIWNHGIGTKHNESHWGVLLLPINTSAVDKHWKLKSCFWSRAVSVQEKMGIGALQTDSGVDMKGWFPPTEQRGPRAVWQRKKFKLELNQSIRNLWSAQFCSVPFLTWGLEATCYPVLQMCYCWDISVAAKILAVSFWRWTWTSLNSDYGTALARSRSMLTDKLKLVCVLLVLMMEWFWEQWRKHSNFSKISEKGGKQSWVFAVYIWIILRSAIWYLKKAKNTSWVISGKENHRICLQDDVGSCEL